MLSVPPRDRPSWKVLREPHFWILIAIITCGTILYYADSFPVVRLAGSRLFGSTSPAAPCTASCRSCR